MYIGLLMVKRKWGKIELFYPHQHDYQQILLNQFNKSKYHKSIRYKALINLSLHILSFRKQLEQKLPIEHLLNRPS